MKILAIETACADHGAEDCKPHLAAEARAVYALYREGLVREFYFRGDRNAAVLVLECPDLATARRHLARLPLVAEALIRFELIPLRPYPGFERLFALDAQEG
jgi:hypothetical protein